MDASVLRKIKKPLIEKKRRDRINHCLNQLKSLLLENVKKNGTQNSRLDKADILEMTVKYLQQLQKQGITSAHDTVAKGYQSGYEECAQESVHYLNCANGIRHDIKSRVESHLSSCVGQVNDELSTPKYSQRYYSFQKPVSVPGNYSYHTPINVKIPSSAQFPSTTPRRLVCSGALLMPVPIHPILKTETAFSPYYPTTESASSTCGTPAEDSLSDQSSGYTSLSGQSFQEPDSLLCKNSSDNSVNNNSLTRDRVWRPW
ncbi:hypothetical protein CHS0354_025560 [Potamilus streckersoni]|uniref:Uncharacterized protein n=1 Tax=Potamilus streckersoni TaxID=2493646 RepID=A0AAE0VM86_9BIVA|nr:hypothetical protein CHS0354_025560 [Potamilus streckersoni]